MGKIKLDKMGMTLFDVKRRRGTPGSQYDARSLKGIRTKTKAPRRPVRPTK